jgi:hypothetical protein
MTSGARDPGKARAPGPVARQSGGVVSWLPGADVRWVRRGGDLLAARSSLSGRRSGRQVLVPARYDAARGPGGLWRGEEVGAVRLPFPKRCPGPGHRAGVASQCIRAVAGATPRRPLTRTGHGRPRRGRKLNMGQAFSRLRDDAHATDQPLTDLARRLITRQAGTEVLDQTGYERPWDRCCPCRFSSRDRHSSDDRGGYQRRAVDPQRGYRLLVPGHTTVQPGLPPILGEPTSPAARSCPSGRRPGSNGAEGAILEQ